MECDELRAPFPWYGGKSRVAPLIWERFGDVANYVEPFFGSGAVLFARPHVPRAETVNDKDCYLANFWRAIQHDPEGVAYYADGPVNEADLHARHLWLVQRAQFRERMKTDPHFYDAKIAGWWVWGISQWIGGGWCQIRKGRRGNVQWDMRPHLGFGQGVFSRLEVGGERGEVPGQKRPNLKRGGTGVSSHSVTDPTIINGPKRKRPLLAKGQIGALKTDRTRPSLQSSNGVHRQLPALQGSRGAWGKGVHRKGIQGAAGILPAGPVDGVHSAGGTPAAPCNEGLIQWFLALAQRLRRTRVCCGDWMRVLGPTPTFKIGLTGVLLDPPYGHKAGRDPQIYSEDDLEVANQCREWAVKAGENPLMRIALCGYEGEHEMPKDWTVMAWKTNGGYGNQRGGAGQANASKERIWFSPHCLEPQQAELFATTDGHR